MKFSIPKKIIAVITILSLILPIFSISNPVLAIEKNARQVLLENQEAYIAELRKISNFNIKPDSTLQNMEYTYVDINGRELKVIEKANDDLSYIESQVFIKNEKGEYVPEYTAITEIGKDKILVTKYENKKITQNIIDLPTTKPVEYKKNQGAAINSEPPISDWELHDT